MSSPPLGEVQNQAFPGKEPGLGYRPAIGIVEEEDPRVGTAGHTYAIFHRPKLSYPDVLKGA